MFQTSPNNFFSNSECNQIFQEAKDTKVIECKIFQSYNGTGIAILTSTYRIFVINNVDDPRVRKMAEVPGTRNSIKIFFEKLAFCLKEVCWWGHMTIVPQMYEILP